MAVGGVRRCLTSIREAGPADVEAITSILQEAAAWLEQKGDPLWLPDEITPAAIAQDVERGLFIIADCDGDPAGTFRFELLDSEVWPEVEAGDSAFVHRLAIRRQYSGGQLSSRMLSWAATHARNLGLSYLRLDCAADRQPLRSLYETFGFRYRGDRQVGPFLVARYELQLRDFQEDEFPTYGRAV